MEQLVLMVGILSLIFIAEKTNVGIYKIVSGFLSFALALTVVTNTLLFVVFIGLALYLIISVFVSSSK